MSSEPIDGHFHSARGLSPERLERLTQKRNGPALLHFIASYALFLGAGTWAFFSWGRSGWEMTISLLAFGATVAGLFAAEHEAAHQTAFKSRALNQWAARLAGIGNLYPPAILRELHFTHHRHTHVPGKDPEITFGGNRGTSTVGSLPTNFVWISGLPFLFMKVFLTITGALGTPEFLRRNAFPFINPRARRQVMLDSILVLTAWVALALLAAIVNPGLWAIFLGLLAGHAFLALYLIPEHAGLPHDAETMLGKTRSMRTNAAVRWLMWNTSYHAEHHAYPAVPYHALPALHEELKAELRHTTTYPGFHLDVLAGRVR